MSIALTNIPDWFLEYRLVSQARWIPSGFLILQEVEFLRQKLLCCVFLIGFFLFETVAPALSSLRKMSTTPLAAAQQNYSINHFYFNITSSKGSIVSTVFGSVLKVLVEVLVSLTTYLDIEFLFWMRIGASTFLWRSYRTINNIYWCSSWGDRGLYFLPMIFINPNNHIYKP